MMRKSTSVLTLLTLTALLASCSPNFQLPGTPKKQTAAGAASDMVKLSQFGNAGLSDIAVDAEGTIHAIFREEHATHFRHQIFYRASTDNGATWSEPLNLSEAERERSVGMIRLAIDGEGRVYAVWWYGAGSGPSGALNTYSNIAGSDLAEGTLVYRVFRGGEWSPEVVIGEKDMTYSWFPSVDPTGKLHVLWVENMSTDTLGSASRIVQASLDGAAVGDREVRWEPEMAQEYGLKYWDRYEGLRGYVDAKGLPHWIASQRKAKDTSGQRTMIYSDGETETELFPESQFGGVVFHLYPANLIVDARGREHVITMDLGGDRPAVVDIALDDGNKTTVVRESESVDGSVTTFQAVAGPKGRAMAFVGVRESKRSEASDMHLVSFDGTQWGESINLTANEARAKFASARNDTGGSVASLSEYIPRYGSGAFGPDGKPHVLLVNDAKTMFSSSASNGLGQSVGFGGSSTDSDAFYLSP